MKTKIFALFAAMMLLVGTTAMAQSDDTKNTSTTETSLKGDVNADGVVDVADIAAVIAVMHEQSADGPEYYWYIGQENPANLDESFDPETKKVTDNTSPGWRYLGSDLSVYNENNKIYEGAIKYTISFPSRNTAYLALPSSSIKLYDDTGYSGVLGDSWTGPIEKEINGVKYYVYTSTSSKLGGWGADVY